AFAAGRAEYTREWNLLSRPAARGLDDEAGEDNRRRWTPHYPQYRFALAPGKHWQGRASAANRAAIGTATRRRNGVCVRRARLRESTGRPEPPRKDT
ncbi:MAG: hypothetical protein ACK4N5_06990, partial [Myxococcales bacterium]